MRMKKITRCFMFSVGLYGSTVTLAETVVVANPDTPALNEATLQKVYLGKVVEVSGRPVVPVNLAKGNVVRKEFMEKVVGMDEDKYIAYWTVRRYIGKGSPPREFAVTQEQREFLRTTSGSVGYQEESPDTKQGVKVILRKP